MAPLNPGIRRLCPLTRPKFTNMLFPNICAKCGFILGTCGKVLLEATAEGKIAGRESLIRKTKVRAPSAFYE
jgi:hypothetical protein